MENKFLSIGKMNLRGKVILVMFSFLSVIMLIVGLVLFHGVSQQLQDSFISRGGMLTKNIASVSTVHIFYEQKEEQQKKLNRIMATDEYKDVQYVLVLTKTSDKKQALDGTEYKLLASWQKGNKPIDQIIAQHNISPDSLPKKSDGLISFTEPVYPSISSMFDTQSTEEDKADNTQGDEDEDLVMPGELDNGFDDKKNDGDKSGAKMDDRVQKHAIGYILLGLSTTQLQRQRKNAWLSMFAVLFIALLLFTILVFLSSTKIHQRLDAIMEAARQISMGNLTQRIEDDGRDEIGQMASALDLISSNLNGVMSAVSKVKDSLTDAVEHITGTTEEVVLGAEQQVESVDDTSSSMSQMIVSIRGIAENVEILATSAEESSSSILEMAATNDEMADNIHSLAASVEQTTTSMAQMAQTIKEVAKNVEELSSVTDETSASMREMDVTIGQVKANAKQTAQISDEVREDAERGAEAVKLTMKGMNRINVSTEEAFDVMNQLGKKVKAIGQILTVIDDVAEQTNLLALNAAIIAAQAGERGKGFAVVADEIKDLAERTASSTSEISDLIEAVQNSTENVINTMERGLRSVKEGVKLSDEAEAALKKILSSTSQSTQMVQEIARATVEQSRSSKEVTISIQRIADTVQQIAAATAQQARGSEQIMGSAERMRIITKHVHGSSQEQARGSKQITKSIENISEMVNHLNRAQREQTKGAEQVMKAVERIKEIAERNSQSMQDMRRSVTLVAKQSDTLREQMAQLKL